VVSLLALMSTVLKSRAISCVRTGNPWMVTFGFPDRPRTSEPGWPSGSPVIALATRSPTNQDYHDHEDYDPADERPALAPPANRWYRWSAAVRRLACHPVGNGRVGSWLIAYPLRNPCSRSSLHPCDAVVTTHNIPSHVTFCLHLDRYSFQGRGHRFSQYRLTGDPYVKTSRGSE